MTDAQRIKILNRLFSLSPFARDTYFYASFGVNAALENSKFGGDSLLSVEHAAKNLAAIYDDSIQVEVLQLNEKYFDALFLLPKLSTAAKKLAGYERAMLIVCGLREASFDGGTRASPRREKAYAQNAELVEAYLMRYKSSFKNLEIIFL